MFFNAYTQLSGLAKHKRLHSGERPFKCIEYDKVFTHSYILKKHKSTHIEERPKAIIQSGLVSIIQTHTGQRPFQFDNCNITGRAPSHSKQHQLTHQKSSIDNTEPQSSEPRQWVVISGQCLPIKQELEGNACKVIVKQEKGECLPIKQELEENASGMIVKHENLDV